MARPVNGQGGGGRESRGSDGALRVVVVDDEPDVRLLLRLQLPPEGVHIVGEAGDGATAVQVCQATRPDAVVLDLLMPIMTGFEAIPAIREHAPDTRIVAYTASAGQFVRDKMAELDVALVLKSGDASDLVAALRGEAPAEQPTSPA